MTVNDNIEGENNVQVSNKNIGNLEKLHQQTNHLVAKKCGSLREKEKRDFRSKIPSPLGRRSESTEQGELSPLVGQHKVQHRQKQCNLSSVANTSDASLVNRNRPKSVNASKVRRDHRTIFTKSVIVENERRKQKIAITGVIPIIKTISEQDIMTTSIEDFGGEKSDKIEESITDDSLSLELPNNDALSIPMMVTTVESCDEDSEIKIDESLLILDASQSSSIESSLLISNINDSIINISTTNNDGGQTIDKKVSTTSINNIGHSHSTFSSKIPKRISHLVTTKISKNINNNFLNNNSVQNLNSSSKLSPESNNSSTSNSIMTHSTPVISTSPSKVKVYKKNHIEKPNAVHSTNDTRSHKEKSTTSTRNEFVRPRLITIIRNGMRPRKTYRYLLNQKTARSFDQVLNDICIKLKPDKGAIRKMYKLDGTEVLSLEGFFDHQDIFLASTTDRVSIEDFELDPDECKSIQPYVKSGKADFRPRKSTSRRFTGLATSSYAVNPGSFTEVSLFPVEITDKYYVGDVIGDGNFSVVRVCRDKSTVEKFAMKIIDKSKCNQDSPPMHEVNILNRLNHPNIVHLHHQFDFTNELYVIMELVTGGDLFNAIAKATKFTEIDSSSMTRDVISALAYLHTRQIVHRDIKPENLLVSFDSQKKRRIKLGDFGLAQIVKGPPLFTICGTPTYVAPEILSETGYGLKVDVWALGVIVYVLLCGYPPFASATGQQDDLFDLILTGEFDFHPDQWENISDDAKDLIYRMIESDVDLRLTAEEVLMHPWLAINQKEYEQKKNRFYRRDFKFSVFETMGLQQAHSTPPMSSIPPFPSNNIRAS